MVTGEGGGGKKSPNYPLEKEGKESSEAEFVAHFVSALKIQGLTQRQAPNHQRIDIDKELFTNYLLIIWGLPITNREGERD